MMVRIKSFSAPPVNVKEIVRYAGGGETELIYECLKEAESAFSYKVCYAFTDVSINDDVLDLGFASVKSKNLAKNLSGCSKAIIFAATVGVGIDRLIGKYNLLSPSKAVCFQAIGAERVEALCDEFENYMIGENKEMSSSPRFSPGYGDLPLEFQKEVFRLLDCPKHIGVSLGEGLLMSPSKSITAIIGFGEKQ